MLLRSGFDNALKTAPLSIHRGGLSKRHLEGAALASDRVLRRCRRGASGAERSLRGHRVARSPAVCSRAPGTRE
jgi:hypothetical protein